MNDQSLRLSLKLFFYFKNTFLQVHTWGTSKKTKKKNQKTNKFHQYQIMRAFISLILSVSVLNVFYRWLSTLKMLLIFMFTNSAR